MKVVKWNIYHSYAMLITFPLYQTFHIIWPVIFISILSFFTLSYIQWSELKQLKPKGGLANYITLLRFLGLVTFSIVFENLSGVQCFIWLIILIILDALDGYLAQKKHQKTTFGAFFDLETDSLFVCLVSCILISKAMIYDWLLVPAYLRYFYIIFVHIARLHNFPEKPHRFGALIAGIMFTTLAFSFIVPELVRTISLTISSALLIFSFLYSLTLLLKAHFETDFIKN